MTICTMKESAGTCVTMSSIDAMADASCKGGDGGSTAAHADIMSVGEETMSCGKGQRHVGCITSDE